VLMVILKCLCDWICILNLNGSFELENWFQYFHISPRTLSLFEYLRLSHKVLSRWL
jgi:AraC-like DNA-binding protein